MRWAVQLVLLFYAFPCIIHGQQLYTLSGKVTDENKSPLPGANVLLNNKQYVTVTDLNGTFVFPAISKGEYKLNVSFLGYKTYERKIDLDSSSLHVEVVLQRSVQTLQEVVVTDNYAETRKRQSALNIEVANKDFLKQHLGGSLMHSMERLPGVSAIEIGSGQSKPVIRGLSFNRVVVTENGVKHEGQQWGTEHGLEIDQYAVEKVEIVKGPASVMHGSDAIGGIVDIKHINIPEQHTIGGQLDLTGKSNNAYLGASAEIYARSKRFFVSGRFTRTGFADYKVPTDSVDIYSYRAPLYQNRLRNTAGQEENIHFSAGFVSSQLSNRLFFSHLSSENGFFANAHGLEPRRVNTDVHDRSSRDIQYPYHKVNHLKIINKTDWRKGNTRLEIDLGLQHNFRQEWSQYVQHGFMPAVFPENMPFPSDLEREFDKYIYSGNAKANIEASSSLSIATGINAQYQKNDIDGRGFIIPAFQQLSTGGFLYGRYLFSSSNFLHAGLRYDYGSLDIERYFDWYQSTFVTAPGDTISDNLLRAPELSRNFHHLTWSAGINYNTENLSIKANVGKSFRMPIAKELAANGVNYHRFSYEVGDSSLSPEISYQIDGGIEWNLPKFAVGISPFLNYFPNYIYLNPGFRHDRLYGNGNQIFNYTQSEVFRFGGEVHAHYNVVKPLTFGFIGEYVYSEQLSGAKKGFSLPFSAPASMLVNVKITNQRSFVFNNAYVSFDYNITAKQNRIVPPEEETNGYQVFNFAAGGEIQVWEQNISIHFQIQNILNTKYFNHTSYYRLINVPGAGRNFILNISIPFYQKLKNNS